MHATDATSRALTGAGGGPAKLHVLHAYKIYKPDVEGGIPAVIATLTRMADPGVVDSEVLTARKLGWFRRSRDGSVPVTAVSSLGDLMSTPLAPTLPFWVVSRARQADVLVHHAPFPLTDLAIALAMPRRTALIVYWHGEIVGRSLVKRILTPLFRRALARADAIVVSNEVMVENSPLLRPFADKCISIPFGIDTAYWRELDDRQRKAVDELRRARPRLIVALGRLVGYKGFDILLQAIKRIDARAVIIGEGPLRTELAALADHLGISDRLTLAGRLPRDEVKALLHAADVFAMPSTMIAEGFGLAQLEAMSAGRPVVNTSLPTAAPLVARNDLEGLTVPPGDPVALADALDRLLRDPSLAQRLGAAGQARAHAEFDQTIFVTRFENLCQRVVQDRCNAR